MAPTDTTNKMLLHRHAGNETISTSSAQHAYLGIGAAVGILLFVTIVVVTIKLLRRRNIRKSIMHTLEAQQAVHRIGNSKESEQSQDMNQDQRQPARPVMTTRRGSRLRISRCHGWADLNSNDSLADSSRHIKSRSYPSIPIPKRLKKRGIPLKRKYLSAIIESPSGKIAGLRTFGNHRFVPADSVGSRPRVTDTVESWPQLTKEDLQIPSPSEPGLPQEPEYALEITLASDADKRLLSMAPRSVSMGIIDSMKSPALPKGQSLGRRSKSVSGPLHPPPSEPIPPLPQIEFRVGEPFRPGILSRLSSESQHSTGSSVLVTSPSHPGKEDKENECPIKRVKSQNRMADNLERYTKRCLKVPNTRISLSETPLSDTVVLERDTSIHSQIARMCDSESFNKGSRADVWCMQEHTEDATSLDDPMAANFGSKMPGNSPAAFTVLSHTAELYDLTRDQHNSKHVSLVETPSALREISNNSIGPHRNASITTQSSSCSSNGNPFQWDQHMQKPSALKGSPNARKGHRRQNGVRISALTPQVLGPPPSRSTSPSITHGIEEEGSEGFENHSTSTRFISNHRIPRSSSATSFGVRTIPRPLSMRASPNTGSPLRPGRQVRQSISRSQSQNSVCQLSRSPSTRSRPQSASPTNFSRFLSPERLHDAVPLSASNLPEVYYTRPSIDEQQPNTFSPRSHLSASSSVPSNPPEVLRYSDIMMQYRPHSDSIDSRHSSISSIQPLNIPAIISPLYIRPGHTSRTKSNTSLRTSQSSVGPNAEIGAALSSLVAIAQVDFPGAPILLPGCASSPSQVVTRTSSVSPISIRSHAYSRSSLNSEIAVPSPLQIRRITHSPGTNEEDPAYALLKHAMALRRMNSDASQSCEGRVYRRLGRENSSESMLLSGSNMPKSDSFLNFSFLLSPLDGTHATYTHISSENNLIREHLESGGRSFIHPGDIDDEAERFWQEGGSERNFLQSSPAAGGALSIKSPGEVSSYNSPPEAWTLARPDQGTPTKTPRSMLKSRNLR